MTKKRLTIRELANNYNNKNLRTLVDNSHQKVAETAEYTWNSSNLDPLIIAW